MDYILYELSSFTYNSQNGNKAGVILNSEKLSIDERQAIAAKYQYSEIAYIEQSSCADFKIEFFTPNSEVDLCGHATICAFGLLKQLDIITIGKYSAELKAGIINVDVSEDTVLMSQVLPKYGEVINKEEIAASLNINTNSLSNLNCQMISTGLFDIMVPIINREILNNIKPNFKTISDISEKYNAVGYHLFTIEDGIIYTRNFAPLYEIDEECATGSSSGALACYLYENNLVTLNKNYIIYQGESMNMKSEISVFLKGDDNITEVLVGGKYSTYIKKV